MCGIFGFQTDNFKIIKKLTKDFLLYSEERGKEASGICISNNNEYTVLKKPCSGFDLSKLKDFNFIFDKMIKNNNSIYSLIGQCRLATDGKSYIEEYNHPAIYDNICLVHNGIILNSPDILQSQNLNKIKVDKNKTSYMQSDTLNDKK